MEVGIRVEAENPRTGVVQPHQQRLPDDGRRRRRRPSDARARPAAARPTSSAARARRSCAAPTASPSASRSSPSAAPEADGAARRVPAPGLRGRPAGRRAGRRRPFGAVVARGDDVLAGGHNQVVAMSDPTAHAEIGAIRAACARLESFQLEGCDLYSSCEPCPMCLGAIYWARPRAVFFSATRQTLPTPARRRVRLRGARASAGRAQLPHAPHRAPGGGRAVRRVGGEARPRRVLGALQQLGPHLQVAQLTLQMAGLPQGLPWRLRIAEGDVADLVLRDADEPRAVVDDLATRAPPPAFMHALSSTRPTRAMYTRPAPSATKSPGIAFLFSRMIAAPRTPV